MGKIQQFTPDEDSQLLLSWHRGDLSAFETLVWKYQKRIFNLAILLTGDHEAAATATENSFLTAYQDIRSLTGRARFSTWLVAIALKECRRLNYFRSAESPPSEIPPSAGLQDILHSVDPSAMMQKLAFCLRDLPVELTELILLRYVRGYSLEKLEEIFLIRADILLSRLFEAEEALTACLKSGSNRSDTALPHPETRRNFSAYLDITTDDHEKVATKEHLKSCGSCREALADLEWMIEHLKSLPDEEPPHWLTTSIMEKARNIPEKPAELEKPSYFAIQAAAGMLLLAIIGVSTYLLTNRDEIFTPKPSGEASRTGNSADKSAEGKNPKPEDRESLLKGVFRGAGLLEDKKPKTSPQLPAPSGPSPQVNPPTALPTTISPPVRAEQPTAPFKAEPPQQRERAERPQLPSEWSDIQTQGRTPQRKTPAPRPGGEVAVVLATPDPLAATQEIEAAVTSLGGRITGRAYSSGNDILYTRIEVEKLIDLVGKLRKVGKLQELPNLPDNAEGSIDLVIKW